MSEKEIRALRDENTVLKAELDEVRASTNQYLQNVAHQLTAPLGAIKWSIEALRNPQVPLHRYSRNYLDRCLRGNPSKQ